MGEKATERDLEKVDERDVERLARLHAESRPGEAAIETPRGETRVWQLGLHRTEPQLAVQGRALVGLRERCSGHVCDAGRADCTKGQR